MADVTISAQRIVFPNLCVCCGEPADTVRKIRASRSKGKRVVRTETKGWEVPYCTACRSHVARWRYVDGLLGVALVLVGTAGIGMALLSGPALLSSPEGDPDRLLSLVGCSAIPGVIGLLALGLLLTISRSASNDRARAQAEMKATCACPGEAARYKGWYASQHAFWFASDEYATALVSANEGKVVDASAPVLEAAREVQLTRTIQEMRESDDEIVVKALAQMEAKKGPAARTAVLHAALAKLATSPAQDRLVREAARLEVHAVLDKVDGLKTAKSKVRHLREAIERLRADEHSDQLQAEAIHLLEEALREIEGEEPQA